MNLNELGLHEGLLRALEARELDSLYPFLEKTFEHVNRKRENISAQVRLGSGREYVYLAPLMQWLLTEGQGGKALVILPSEQDVAAVKSHALLLADAVGIPVHAIGRDPDAADASAPLSIGAAEILSIRRESDTLDLRSYGFVVVDGVERCIESPQYGYIRQIRSSLLPAWERRTMVVSEKLGTKEQTLAMDLADAPTELYLEEEAEKVKHVPQTTWYVASDAKMRLLLGILAKEAPKSAAVFCNLKESAEEATRRLTANGKRAEFVLENLPQSRKDSLLARVRSGELEAVVFTDEGAKGITLGTFPLVVNFDIPLEGEPYLDRVRLLDAAAPGACVFNLACDRYVYGIPAVEQFMGISLGATQADEAFFAPLDKSAGMNLGRGNRSDGRNGRRDNPSFRRPQGGDSPYRGRDRSPGPSGDRGPRREGSGFRRDGREREPDPRNQESIRAGIAELTGVNLGGSGARNHPQGNPFPRAREPQQREPQQREPRERDPQQREPQQREPQQRGPRPEGSGHSSGGKGRRRNNRGRKGGVEARVPGANVKAPGASFEDPYAIPMEERMRLYKEKYGKRLTESGPAGPSGRKKNRRRKGSGSGSSPAASAPRAPQAPNGQGNPPRDTDIRAQQPLPKQEKPGESGSDDVRGGLLGKLFGGLRKDREE